jgi:hypothetical protein
MRHGDSFITLSLTWSESTCYGNHECGVMPILREPDSTRQARFNPFQDLPTARISQTRIHVRIRVT